MRAWQKLPIYRDSVPKYVVNGAVALYFAVIGVLLVMYPSYYMGVFWTLFGSICIFSFYYGSRAITSRTRFYSPKRFEKYIMRLALTIRMLTVIVLYGMFYQMTGGFFDFEASDVLWYDEVAVGIADRFYNGEWNIWQNFQMETGGKTGIDDSGYPVYLGVVYIFTGKSKLIARLIQCVWSAYICLFVYRIAQRHFEEPTARLAAIFCLFMPNMVIYQILHRRHRCSPLQVWNQA